MAKAVRRIEPRNAVVDGRTGGQTVREYGYHIYDEGPAVGKTRTVGRRVERG